MIELHLCSDSLRKKLIWFNDQKNHFIVEFSDDGAPESKDGTMCIGQGNRLGIGSLTLWNLESVSGIVIIITHFIQFLPKKKIKK